MTIDKPHAVPPAPSKMNQAKPDEKWAKPEQKESKGSGTHEGSQSKKSGSGGKPFAK
ncbi:MAG: hypothetical protein ABI551_27295 [Polyangiaceae bacterium]